MKKFLKKRPPEAVTFAQAPSPIREPVPTVNHDSSRQVALMNAQLEEMRRHYDTMAVENAKLKSAMQRLSEENISLKDQLAHQQELVQASVEAKHQQNTSVIDSRRMDEIQNLVKLVTEENDHLQKQLQLEREHSRESQRVYEQQVQRLTSEFERCQLENMRLQQQLQTAILENDDLRIRASLVSQERIVHDDIGMRSSLEACKILLDELRAKYKEEMSRMQVALEKSLDEKRALSLRVAQLESDAEAANRNKPILWENARILEGENRKFSALLDQKDERIAKMETMFNELLNVAREMANARAKGEKTWVENRHELMTRLQKLERKCQNLKDDNEKLKQFKQEAVSKLIEARKLLLVDN